VLLAQAIDADAAETAAIAEAFPDSLHFRCKWHLLRDVNQYAMKLGDARDRFTAEFARCQRALSPSAPAQRPPPLGAVPSEARVHAGYVVHSKGGELLRAPEAPYPQQKLAVRAQTDGIKASLRRPLVEHFNQFLVEDASQNLLAEEQEDRVDDADLNETTTELMLALATNNALPRAAMCLLCATKRNCLLGCRGSILGGFSPRLGTR